MLIWAKSIAMQLPVLIGVGTYGKLRALRAYYKGGTALELINVLVVLALPT